MFNTPYYIKSRESIIIDLIKNKRVLDIGSIGQSDEYCLWNIINQHAIYVVGVDLEHAIEDNKRIFNLRESAFLHCTNSRIVYGNMEELDLQEKFDIVIAGDVIEHVNNQGLFLNNINRHLKDNGKLILTTPNAKWITVFLKPNPTHVLWHDIYTLKELIKRHRFRLESYYYYCGNKLSYSFLAKLLLLRQSILIVATPDKNP